ncbi:MAG TPA: methylmalonyl Co-A mutase-associated GTPase MeaB [Flavisolibacter sp.]|nr:methylmalonyl Co-A mutase-associated GTPase MeaB [Flavisolibacter sp.]
MWQQLLKDLQNGNTKALARSISFVENEQEGYEELLQALTARPQAKIIGITGPPGAGKSTLVDALIGELLKEEKKVAVLCVDPSSPFNLGAVLGDRIRMSDWYTNENVFIRSLATRGSMGGLHPKIIEITELVKAAGYDYVIVETVGVGQSEIEIAGLADTTIVVVVPEAGDEVQTMKAGLMEIADIFVVNKSDRPDADAFVKNLRLMLAPAFVQHQQEVPVIKTIASAHTGIEELKNAISKQQQAGLKNERKAWLLAEKAYHLIQQRRMKDIDKTALQKQVAQQATNSHFNLYQFIQPFILPAKKH